MSQQEMEFGGAQGYGPEAGSPPLSGHAQFSSYNSAYAGQKITSGERRASPEQRLALSIVSLALWFLLFIGVAMGFASAYSDGQTIVALFLGMGLFLFTALVVFINMLFYRQG